MYAKDRKIFSMSRYKVIIKEEAQADLKKLLHNEPKSYQKALRFIGEL